MSLRRTVIVGWLGWVAAVSLLHGALNQGLLNRPAARGPGGARAFRVGFLPVT
jgi:hypothetical protein